MKPTSIIQIEKSLDRRSGLGTAPFLCGIVNPIVYVATDVASVTIWPDCSHINETVVRLSAIGAPRRSVSIAVSVVFNRLVVALGIGLYSKASIVTVPVFGGLVNLHVPSEAAKLPPPSLGVTERVSVYAPIVWSFMLVAGQLRTKTNSGARM